MRLQTPLLAVIAVATAALVACTSNDASTPATTTTTSTSSTSTSTSTSTTTTLPPTTTTEAPKATYPLTGLPVDDEAAALRPAIVAKIGNYDGHTQSGLNEADIVIEEIINDGYTRFAAVFQSVTPADIVGPLRSGRLQDVNLLGSLNRPILVWSGGNATVVAEINNSDLINMSESRCNGACVRVDFDRVPYNLFVNVEKAWTRAPEGGQTPPPQFHYRTATDALAGTPAAAADVPMAVYRTSWTWNASTGLYERTQNGRNDVERNGDRVTTDNVVIMVMPYVDGISESPDAQSIGSGVAYVLTGGNVVQGRWSRSDRLDPFVLTADDGSEILLTPGRTFVQLPRTGAKIVFT